MASRFLKTSAKQLINLTGARRVDVGGLISMPNRTLFARSYINPFIGRISGKPSVSHSKTISTDSLSESVLKKALETEPVLKAVEATEVAGDASEVTGAAFPEAVDSVVRSTSESITLSGDVLAEYAISGEILNREVVAAALNEIYYHLCLVMPDMTYIQFMERLSLHITVFGGLLGFYIYFKQIIQKMCTDKEVVVLFNGPDKLRLAFYFPGSTSRQQLEVEIVDNNLLNVSGLTLKDSIMRGPKLKRKNAEYFLPVGNYSNAKTSAYFDTLIRALIVEVTNFRIDPIKLHVKDHKPPPDEED